MSTQQTDPPAARGRARAGPMDAILNLALHHRAHERFSARAPLEVAIGLQRASGTLTTLADRWAVITPAAPGGDVPFAGCEDLNEPAAIPSDGVLFMEGQGTPAALLRLRRDLGVVADDCAQTSVWLSEAMEASWQAAGRLRHPGLADLLGERHRIIANDWQAAGLGALVSRLTRRASDLLGSLDLSPGGVRADLAGPRSLPGYLHSCAELLDRAADLAAESAVLVHDNERRWRVFRHRVAGIAQATRDPTS